MASHATVGDVMLRHPKTLPSTASIVDVRAALLDDHVGMVLLLERSQLVGTLTQADLPPLGTGGTALRWSRLAGRTVVPGEPAEAVRAGLSDRGLRRVAVVGTGGELLGLMCLKRSWLGFCSDADVVARAGQPVDARHPGGVSGHLSRGRSTL